MSHYALDELIARWGREELTPEQMIGHMLQLLRAQQERLREFERRLPLTAPERGVDVIELKHKSAETAQVTVVGGDNHTR